MYRPEDAESESAQDCILINEPFVEYCFDTFSQLSDRASDVRLFCDAVTLLGRIEAYKSEFIEKNGIEQLIALFQTHRQDVSYAPFLSAFMSILPGSVEREA